MVLTSSYTASLTSMLTVQQLQPTVTDVHELLQSGECVGYQRGSYVKGLLEELGFDRLKIKPYDPDDFHEALSRGSNNGGIAALVHEVPYIKLFLSNHCKGYTMVGPIYKAAGFGYVSLTTLDMLLSHYIPTEKVTITKSIGSKKMNSTSNHINTSEHPILIILV